LLNLLKRIHFGLVHFLLQQKMSPRVNLSDPPRFRQETYSQWRWVMERFVLAIVLLAAVYSTVVIFFTYILSLAYIIMLRESLLY
jgi:hypothetical protein